MATATDTEMGIVDTNTNLVITHQNDIKKIIDVNTITAAVNHQPIHHGGVTIRSDLRKRDIAKIRRRRSTKRKRIENTAQINIAGIGIVEVDRHPILHPR